jgi:hypothetical protein
MASEFLISTLRQLQGANELGEKDIEMTLEPKPENFLLWLLILDLLVFVGLSAYAYISSKRMEKEGTSAEDFRYKFMKSLIYANGGKDRS